eukprot:2505660-Rhodomonas_salina.1
MKGGREGKHLGYGFAEEREGLANCALMSSDLVQPDQKGEREMMRGEWWRRGGSGEGGKEGEERRGGGREEGKKQGGREEGMDGCKGGVSE